MRIEKTRAFPGPNIWSRQPVLEFVLEPIRETGGDEFSLRRCRERLLGWYGTSPDEKIARVVNRHRFVQRLERVRTAAGLFAALVQELQTLAGMPVTAHWIETAGPRSTTCVAVEFAEEPIARLAVEFAARLVDEAPAQSLPDFQECVRELRDCAKEACFGGTTGPIVEAACSRGIPVVRLDGDCLVQLGHGARQRRLMGSITSRTGFLSEAISRDKSLTKQLLRQMGIPVPPGRLVSDADDAWAAACELGLPVVVKPRDEDCGTGVSLMLKTREQISLAYAQAREYRPDVLVERHLPGAAHRLFVVNDRLVAAIRRDPAQVVGDGRQTIAQLIALANRDPRRGEGPEYAMFPIVVDEEAVQILADRQLSLNSIPRPDEAVALRYDPKAGYGGTVLEVTESVHPETIAAVCDAVRVTGLDVAGVDVMAADIALPLGEQQGGILEVNGGPAIYLHRSPFCEPSRPVAEAIVDSLIPGGETGRIPIVAVLGDAQATAVARQVARLLDATGQTVGLAAADGIRVGDADHMRPLANNASGCRTLLLHPRVELAVCEISLKSLREEGLAFDKCQVAILTSWPTVPETADTPDMIERCLRVLLDSVYARGAVIANIDDPSLAALFVPGDDRLVAVSHDENHPYLFEHRERGGTTVFADGGDAVINCGGQQIARQTVSAKMDDAHVVSWLLAFAADCALEQPVGQAVPDAIDRRRRQRVPAHTICAP